MGVAFIVPNADYRANNIGTVTPTTTVTLDGIVITGPSSVYVSAKFSVLFVPTFTTERNVS